MDKVKYLILLIGATVAVGHLNSPEKSMNDGITIESANSLGLHIQSSGSNGIQIDDAGIDGLQVQSAGRDGVRISNAAEYGINAKGTTGAAFLDGKVIVTAGLNADNLGINISPAVNTRLGVKGNSTFGGNMKLSSLVAIPSAANNILEVEFDSFTDPIADAWTTYSSRRWKSNIRTLDNALEKIGQLRGVSFHWKKNGKSDFGLIAEEVGAVLPEIVAFEENGIDAKSVDYARIVALLIEAIKEQQIMIDEIKRKCQ